MPSYSYIKVRDEIEVGCGSLPTQKIVRGGGRVPFEDGIWEVVEIRNAPAEHIDYEVVLHPVETALVLRAAE